MARPILPWSVPLVGLPETKRKFWKLPENLNKCRCGDTWWTKYEILLYEFYDTYIFIHMYFSREIDVFLVILILGYASRFDKTINFDIHSSLANIQLKKGYFFRWNILWNVCTLYTISRIFWYKIGI